jgi:hypothetical protein
VFYFALVDDGHGLEAAVRVFSNTEPFSRRRKLHRTGKVKEQERTERRSQVGISKQCPDGKPVSYPMEVHTALDAAELL